MEPHGIFTITLLSREKHYHCFTSATVRWLQWLQILHVNNLAPIRICVSSALLEPAPIANTPMTKSQIAGWNACVFSGNAYETLWISTRGCSSEAAAFTPFSSLFACSRGLILHCRTELNQIDTSSTHPVSFCDQSRVWSVKKKKKIYDKASSSGSLQLITPEFFMPDFCRSFYGHVQAC